jgi:hypothetical protein
MQYLVLIYEDESRFAAGYSETELAEYGAHGKANASAIQGGQALEPTATAKTVRVRNGQTITSDGPFAETKEQLGGFYLVDTSTLDQALAFAAGIPAARYGCVEVRPIHRFA